MNRIMTVVMAGLVATSMLWGATGADFGMSIAPGSTLIKGTEGGTATGSVDYTVLLTSAIAEVQGWSFGVKMEVGGNITAIASSFEVMHVLNNAKPGFQNLSYFSASDLVNAKGKNDDNTGICTFAETDITAITQGIVIDFMSVVSLPIVTDYPMVTFTATVTGAVGAAEAQVGTIAFTDLVGNPPTPTVVVHGGASLPPDVMAGAVINAAPTKLVPAAAFTIDVGEAAVEPNEGGPKTTTVPVYLSFNADGTNDGALVQGWSYSVCADDIAKGKVIAATYDGTDTAVVSCGAKPGFDTITVEADGSGVTHGVVVDLMAACTLPASNGYFDLKMTVEADLPEPTDEANPPKALFFACSGVFGNPPTPAVMVIGGNSIPSNQYFGTNPADTESGCVDPTICNQPGYVYSIPAGKSYVPGRINADGKLDLADGIFLLSFLFRGGPAPACVAAADINGDALVDVSDAINLIYWYFNVNDALPPAQGLECGKFKTDLPCDVQTACN